MATPSTRPDTVEASSTSQPVWLVILVALGAALLLLAAGLGVFRWAQGLASSVAVTAPPALAAEEAVACVGDGCDSAEPDSAEPLALNQPVVVSQEGEPTPAPLASTNAFQPWGGTERVNILLLGNDLRCEEAGPTRTDSIMLLSIDPVNLSVSALSLPRDLWVDIPGIGLDRINQAHYWGEYYELPGGGPALAMKTVENFVGVPVDHYVAIDFDGFVQFIDLIGGIDIQIPETIDDPNYPDECYGFSGFYVEAGWYEGFDGQATLKYARTRATEGGDVDRAARQQAVLLAVRDRVLRLNKVPQLIARSPQLWQTLQAHVSTTLTDVQVIQLALLLQDIPADNIRSAVVDYGDVLDKTTPDGREVLVPIRQEVRALRRLLFEPIAAPAMSAEVIFDAMAQENARVVVYNGTPTFGLAGATQRYLESKGVNVTGVGNADAATYPATVVLDYGDHPGTLHYLTRLMQLPPLNASRTDDRPEGEFDVLIIIGNDWRVPEE